MAVVITDALGAQYALSVDATDGSLITTPVHATPSTPDNSYTIKVIDMIAGALRLIGVQAAGEPVKIDEAHDALVSMNEMTDAWNADGAMIFTTRIDDYNLIANKQSYTLGTGGDFGSNRPALISSMSALLLDNPANPIEIPIAMYTTEQWQNQVPVKHVTGTFPQICYDDGGFPLRTLSMWPIPPTSINAVRIYSWQSLTLQTGFTSTMAFPPGYAEAYRFNLALRLAPEYEKTPSPYVVQNAIDSKYRLATLNAPELLLISDLAQNPAGWNYKQTEFGIPW